MPVDRFSDLIAAIPAFLGENVTPGAAVAVYDRSGELFCRGFGSRDAAGRLPVDGDTRFAYASISKTMTALIAGALVQRGLLSWEARVRSLLPAFRLADPWASERCTLRDLFLHRSGLPACDLIFWRRPISPADVFRIVAATPHAHEFRTAFQLFMRRSASGAQRAMKMGLSVLYFLLGWGLCGRGTVVLRACVSV